MFTKILKLYPRATILKDNPDLFHSNHYHWFYDIAAKEWLIIPREDIEGKELSLLKSLFEYFGPINRDEITQSWFQFLYGKGEAPPSIINTRYRIVQFSCAGEDIDKVIFEQALKGFLSENTLLLWENKNNGILIEKEHEDPLFEGDFLPIAQTLETDFFLKVFFYIGKFFEGTKLANVFQMEKTYFKKVLSLLPAERTFTFEKVFPIIVTLRMPDDLQNFLIFHVLDAVKNDSELLTTVQVFIENNMNATLTAKKLYIHRNTLQYRLDKFAEKTGVTLKDFHTAFTIYAACLIRNQYS